jgi:hypothetical protein
MLSVSLSCAPTKLQGESGDGSGSGSGEGMGVVGEEEGDGGGIGKVGAGLLGREDVR